MVKKAKTNSGSYFQNPLAPAPLPVLCVVIIFGSVALAGISDAISNDVLSTFAGMLILVVCAALLDVTGRAQAIKKPNPIYRADKLPTEKTVLKTIMVATTLAALIASATATAQPGEFGSPFPYYLAAGFLFLVMPQLIARKVVRRAKQPKK